MKTKHRNESRALSGRCVGRLEKITFDNGTKNYLRGCVVTPHGIVSVYAQGDADSFHATHLDIVFNGREYTRHWNKRYTERGIVLLARRFARDVLKQQAAPIVDKAVSAVVNLPGWKVGGGDYCLREQLEVGLNAVGAVIIQRAAK